MPACKSKLGSRSSRRPQWPRLYLLSRPRSHGHMPSLVGDRGQVLRVLGWALTRICNLSLVLYCATQGSCQNGGCVWNRAVSCLAI